MVAAVETMANPSLAPKLDYEIVIVGSGFAGLGAAIKLKEMHQHDFTILEKADDLGGTWRDNTYPGLTVDIVSLTYSYSFEPNPDWSRLYAPGAELKQYADHCANKYGIRQHIQFNTGVKKVVYDDQHNVWITHLENGEMLVSRYFVSASGLLVLHKMPDIPGIDSFKGKVVHTARWDHDYDLTDKRVAVIGTGATAIQLLPEIVDKVKRLDVYQRTPIWLLPKLDIAVSKGWKWAFRHVPFLQKAARLVTNFFTELFFGVGFAHNRQFPWMYRWIEKQGIKHIRKQVKDPEIQDKLIPDYTFFCKRPSFSNVYFPIYNRDNVELITDPIDHITENGIVTKDGNEREIDTLICATGYSIFDRGCMPTFEVVGKDGNNLGDFWQANRFQAYMGATLPKFPNFFLILGPYSAASASYFGMIDTQVRHMTRCLKAAEKRHANYIEVKQSAHDKDFAEINKRRINTVLFNGNCARSNSYYYDIHGDTPLLRPVTHMEAWLKSYTFSLNNYKYESR